MPRIIVPSEDFFEVWTTDDTESERSFLTYFHYLDALHLFLEARHGPMPNLYDSLALVLHGMPAYQRLSVRSCDAAKVEKALRNAWATEIVVLQAAATRNAEVVACANLWATIHRLTTPSTTLLKPFS